MKLSEAFARKTYRSRDEHTMFEVSVPVSTFHVERISKYLSENGIGIHLTPAQLARSKTFRDWMSYEFAESLRVGYEEAFEDIMGENIERFRDIAAEIK